MGIATDGDKFLFFGKVGFKGFVPLDLTTLPVTVHQKCRRLALHLAGSDCIAAVVESPVQGQENEAMGCNGCKGSPRMLSMVKRQSALIPTWLLIMMAHWRRPRAFPAGDDLATFWTHALDIT